MKEENEAHAGFAVVSSATESGPPCMLGARFRPRRQQREGSVLSRVQASSGFLGEVSPPEQGRPLL